MSKRTNIIWVIVCLTVMGVCIGLGARYHKGYISLGGVIFCVVGLTVLGIINKVQTWRYMKHELKEIAGEITRDAKKTLKLAPLGDKIKLILLFGSLGLLLLTMAVGVACARIGTLPDGTITKIAIIGFILMGIGGGGFFLEIILLAVISSIKNR